MEKARSARDHKQAARRAEIVKAAARLFFEKGFGRTSIDDVIGAVGGSKRTLYAHFSRKEDLFAAIVSEVSGQVLGRFDVEIKPSLEESLQFFGEQYMKTLLSEDGLMLYRAMVSEARHFPGLAQAFFENGPRKILDRVVELFAIHERAGHCRVVEPHVTAMLFIGMMRGDHQMAAVLTGKKLSHAEVRRYVASAVQTLLHGSLLQDHTEGVLEARRSGKGGEITSVPHHVP